jgi:hypothetical protein
MTPQHPHDSGKWISGNLSWPHAASRPGEDLTDLLRTAHRTYPAATGWSFDRTDTPYSFRVTAPSKTALEDFIRTLYAPRASTAQIAQIMNAALPIRTARH